MSTSLTLYGTNSASATLSSARNLVAVTGASGNGLPQTQLGTLTGYGEIPSAGTAAVWPALGALGAPSGNGWLFDDPRLENQLIPSNLWAITIQTALSVGTATVTVYIRAYKYNINTGTYTAIGSPLSVAGINLNTTLLSTAPTGTLPPMYFLSGDRLYIDVWYNVTANTTGSATAKIKFTNSNDPALGRANNMQVVTAGYQPLAANVRYRSTVIADSPIRYYRLGDTAGISAWEESPAHSVGTEHGAVTLGQTGAIANDPDTAMKFDGATGYISIPTTGLPSGTARWSIEAWGKTANAAQTGYQCLVAFGNRAANQMANLLFYNGGGGGQAVLAIFGNDILGPVGQITTGTWFHLVGTYDGTNTNLYVNGVQVATVAAVPNLNLQFASIGADGTSQIEWFNGTLDEVAIYNTTLSATQVMNHYLAGIKNTVGPYTVYIAQNGAWSNVFVDAGTLQINGALGRTSQAQLTVHTVWGNFLQPLIGSSSVPNAPTHFQQFQQIAIFDGNNATAFTGYITVPKEQKPGFQNSLETQLTCIDQTFCATKRRVAATYTNKTCGFIAQDILNNILSQEGVTLGQIYDGLTPEPWLYPSTTLYPGGNVGLVPQANFVYSTVADAFKALAKAASASGVPYYWQIDKFKRLWFVPYTAVVNSTLVDGTQIEMVRKPPYVIRANPLFRNTQYIIGGYAQTATQTEVRSGDGHTQNWPMSFDLAQAPTISVNTGSGFVAQTVGVRGVDTGKQWYWQQGDPNISQDSSGTPLRGSPNFDLLQVVYVGQYPTAVSAQNAAQVSYAAALDGTSGIIEDVQQDNTLTSVANGMSEASQFLTLYAQQGTLLEFTTKQTGFAQGQLVTVNLSAHGLNNAQMLVSEVQASDQLDGINIWYTVKAALGPYDTTWVDFFSQLLRQQAPANSINIGLSQSLNLAASFSATVTPTATLVVNVYSCPLPNTTLLPATTLFAC